MIVVNQIGSIINVSCNGKDNSVAFSKKRMAELSEIAEKSTKIKKMSELQDLIDAADAICEIAEGQAVSDFHPSLFKDAKSGKYYLLLDKAKKIVSSVAIPDPLVRRIEESMDKGISVDPLMKAWMRFLRNPKASNARFGEKFFNYIDMKYVMPDKKAELIEAGYNDEKATEMATTYQVKITAEGLINCFKVSSEVDWKYEADEDGNRVKKNLYARTFDPITGEIQGDSRDGLLAEERTFLPAIMGTGGDEFYCEGGRAAGKLGHIIKVGSTHRLPDWSYVDTRDEVSCVKGLHVGGLYYIASISGEIHNVFVDPMHVGAIPDDSSGALRCLQYFVHSALDMVNDSIYHSSEYAAKTDAQWAAIKKEILKDFGTLKADQKKNEAETKAL